MTVTISWAILTGLDGTHIFRRIHLQVRGSLEELFKQWKDAITFEHALKTTEETHVKLSLSPGAGIDILLQLICDLLQDLCGEFWLVSVDVEDNCCNEWDPQRLFNCASRISLVSTKTSATYICAARSTKPDVRSESK